MASWANGVSIDYTFYETPTTHKHNENISSFVDYSIYKNVRFFIKTEILTMLYVKRKALRVRDFVKHLEKIIAGMRPEKRDLYKDINLGFVVYRLLEQLRKSNFVHYQFVSGYDFYYLYKYKKDVFDNFFYFDLFNKKRFVRYFEKNFKFLKLITFFKLNILLSCFKKHLLCNIKDIHLFCNFYSCINQYRPLLRILKKSEIIIGKRNKRNQVYFYIKGDLYYE